MEKNRTPIRDAVTDLMAAADSSNPFTLAGFVLDMLCTPILDVARGFGVPAYLFYPSGAAALALHLHLQDLYESIGSEAFTDYINSGEDLSVPAIANPIPIRQVIPSFFMMEEEAFHLITFIKRYRETHGILLNTFEELEPKAVESLRKAGPAIPPIYPVGPILNLTIHAGNEILGWLDEQPPSSVVFLCFGSMGCFDAELVREVADGLERSGHRFLWSLRRPAQNGSILPEEYSDPEEVLPAGFLQRTAEVGRVIGWAPQAAALSHPAVGGFVSHCGWNSVLESLWFGVPIATWPMFVEQQLNAFTLARELGLAMEITVAYRRELGSEKGSMVLTAEEVGMGIRRVMELSRKAVGTGGSSYTWMGRFMEDAIRNISF